MTSNICTADSRSRGPWVWFALWIVTLLTPALAADPATQPVQLGTLQTSPDQMGLHASEVAQAAPTTLPSKDQKSVVAQAIPPLPAVLRGAFTGTITTKQGTTLIVAGGVLGPDVGPDLATAKFSNTVHYLFIPAGSGNAGAKGLEWKSATMAAPLAFGATAVDGDSLLCIGGLSADGISARVARLTFTSSGMDEIPLPNLPSPLALAGAAVRDGVIYVVGGVSNLDGPQFHTQLLTLKPKDSKPEWIPLSTPTDFGEFLTTGLIRPSVSIRREEKENADLIYIFGGWTLDAATSKYVPSRQVWGLLPPRRAGLQSQSFKKKDAPADLAVVSAAKMGLAHIIVLAQQWTGVPADLHAVLSSLGQTLRKYHAFSDTWAPAAAEMNPASASDMLALEKQVLLLEPTPQSMALTRVNFDEKPYSFGWAGYSVIFGYLVMMLVVGHGFTKSEKNTKDYFLGGQRIPWWAAGISIWATGVSALSMMGIPYKTYSMDWSYCSLAIYPVFALLIAAYVFVPMMRRLSVTTLNQYIEMRFHRGLRYLGGMLGIIAQLAGRMSMTLYLPSLALSAVSGLSVTMCILVMGVVTTFYTVLGGFHAVVWTDFAQTILMIGGATITFIYVLSNIEGGASGMIDICMDYDKFRMFNTSFDLTQASMYVFFFWGMGEILGKLGDQTTMQRAFSTEGDKQAKKAVITCALVSIPTSIIFYATGSALFAYYYSHPELLPPTMPSDAIVPLFVVQQVPEWMAGFIIAGIFAAAMSTLSSAMNMVSTWAVTDYYSVLAPRSSEGQRLFVAKLVTLIAGSIGTLMALWLSRQNLGSVWDMFSKIMSLVGGGFGCVMVLGVLTRRATTAGTVVGILCGSLALYAVELYAPAGYKLHFQMYGMFSVAVGFTTGYLASLIIPSHRRNLDGLTIWTLRTIQPKESAQTTESAAAVS